MILVSKVYILEDDLREDEIRFVGICEDVESVLKDHESLRKNQALNEWVTSCIRAGFPPIVRIVEENCGEDSLRVWIEIFRRRGHRLFNEVG